jgi:Family of unknown function (DUF5994)
MSNRIGPPNLSDLVPGSAVTNPRLYLDPNSSLDLLDGAWWPRSSDASAELPELVLALDGLHGEIASVLLGADGWRKGSEDLRIGGRRVAVGYFASQPASLLTAVCEHGEHINLLVVRPRSTEIDAANAIHAAATGNRMTAAYRGLARRGRNGSLAAYS